MWTLDRGRSGLSFCCFCFKESMLGAQSKKGFHDGQTMGDFVVAAALLAGALRKARSLPLRAPDGGDVEIAEGMEQAERMLHPRILVMERRAPGGDTLGEEGGEDFLLLPQWTRIAPRGSFA